MLDNAISIVASSGKFVKKNFRKTLAVWSSPGNARTLYKRQFAAINLERNFIRLKCYEFSSTPDLKKTARDPASLSGPARGG